MKPALKMSLGLVVVLMGLLLLAFAVRLAALVGGSNALALGVTAALVGVLLICIGVWWSGVRIKFPPKDGQSSGGPGAKKSS